MAEPEARTIHVRGSADGLGQLLVSTRPPELRLMIDGREHSSAGGADLWACLLDLRRQLEPTGLLMCIEGCRRDVWPSGMSRQMGGGRAAYRHVGDRASDRSDLVDVLDPSPCSEVVVLDEQLASVSALRESARRHSR